MKRLLWCLCLCSLCPTWIVGCGDDEGGGGVEDGGVSQADLEDVNNAIDQLETDLGDLNTNVDSLGDDLNDLTDNVNNLTDDVEGRLDALENPEILSCSESELCIPDGVLLATGGISGIIDLICEHEVDCCTETELNLKFGPGIQTKDDCVGLFTDMVENGFSPDFLDSYLTPSVVYQIIGVAQALNDPRVHVEIDEEGVQACIDSLDTECPEIVEPGPAPDPECVAGQEYEEDPCSLNNLLNGLQEEGELCGDYSYGEGEDIPECEDGFYCSFEGYSNGQEGICAKLPEEGDGCQQDADCDPFGNSYYPLPQSTNLYCNLQNAQCEPLGAEGDPCTFINDDFTIVDESNLYPPSRTATSQDCMNGLTCDPTSNTCVANCSEGRFCSPGQDPFYTCGPDMLCNVTEEPELYDNWSLGTCHAALAEGDTCTADFECETGKCKDDCDVDTGLCACSPQKDPGEACPTPGIDEDCSSNWCGTDEECAALCNCDENQYDGDCEPNVEFTNPTACGDGYYCDFGTYDQESGLNNCEPLIANGVACDTSGNVHGSCASGFCDPETNLCAAKVATDAACPSGLDQQCRSNQYCNNNNICRTYLTAGMNCDLADASGLQCAKGLACVDAATDTCQALAEPGEACSLDYVNEPPCNTDDDYSVTCVDIDGSASGTERRCYSYMGGYADGVDCQFADSYCASGWCRPNATLSPTASACTQPLEEGDDCDTADQTQDVCAEGLYCNHPQNETAGKCAKQHGPGGSCKPYFINVDCAFGGYCTFTKDQYLCDSNSIDESIELFCDGN